ncbi:glycoside hydrolase superfamily [Podospora aff. communis PSN243]|uniref:Glycoside hydrolase superfamily n=1 Tax=Podospora aff. communis PSN243 TaxID=3040156 RepID=A0AAV9G5G5_9PEZI|nr:glycoside hydrolase superfamily [Podospora aff. communis PSN243]
MRVIAFLDTPLVQGTYTIRIKAKNLEDKEVRVLVEMGVTLVGSGAQAGGDAKYVRIGAGREVDVVFEGVVQAPEIWWPAQWGKQPLYNVKLAVKDADGTVSDEAETNFGFRVVQRRLNEFNDSLFIVNRREFQVLGGGYAPDMFLRWDPARWEKELQYALDLGLNTVRLEGKNEHPELYDIADRMGVMIMAGWECCDKWEAWDYNTHMERPSLWTDEDYATANASMRHEAAMMQPHPSVLTYLIGSDFWPNERATTIYLNAFKSVDWQTPVLGSASRQGFSPQTGSPGMLMEGPYDWVPPNYFFDNQPARGGSAYGFGSELSAGVGTPDLSSLKKFLSSADLDDLWKNPRKDLFHMSTAGSTFHNRKIYNDALWARLGAPTSLEDYVQKSQITDYEATRAQFEAWGSMWNAPRPATGVIYWMLTGAFPSLHWNLWDYYMRPSGGYFGAKTALRPEHVAYDPVRKVVHLINRSLDKSGKRALDMSVIDTAGQSVYSGSVQTSTEPNTSKNITSLATALDGAKDLVLLRLTLSDDKNATLSRNTYWIPRTLDALDFGRRDWYYTPVSRYSDYTALSKLGPANVTATATKQGGVTMVALENLSTVPAFFVSLALLDSEGADVLPLKWSDNYVTLWPREKLSLTASTLKGAAEPVAVGVVGRNVARGTVRL